jgi:hypothetical protein
MITPLITEFHAGLPKGHNKINQLVEQGKISKEVAREIHLVAHIKAESRTTDVVITPFPERDDKTK